MGQEHEDQLRERNVNEANKLEPKFYRLNEDPEALAFFKKETRIDDEEQLKQHIMRVQARAYEVFPYPCIRSFGFTTLRLARLPEYGAVLKMGQDKGNAIFLDLGCCFGNDSRKLVHDGFPISNVVASDLRKGLWDSGHELFRSTPESYPMHFVEGDIFNHEHLAPLPPFTQATAPTAPPPALDSLSSLNPLRGHVRIVFTGALFHLFSEERQFELAHSLASLLSPEPGSMILGAHAGKSGDKGFWQPSDDFEMFCHSPSSWAELWEGIFGGKDHVEVRATLRREVHAYDNHGMFPGDSTADPWQWLEWSVTRK